MKPKPPSVGPAHPANTARRYFYVIDSASGWTLRTGDDPDWHAPVDYGSQEEALAVAAVLAHAEWKRSGCPTGVRVQSAAGDWHEARTFGRETVTGSAPRSP